MAYQLRRSGMERGAASMSGLQQRLALVLASLYAGLAAAAAWRPLLEALEAARGGLGLALAGIVSGGSAAATWLGYPVLAWLVSALGLAASLSSPLAVAGLLLASSALYTLSSTPSPRPRARAAAAAALWVLAALAAGVLVGRAAAAALSALSSPPPGTPEPIRTAWASFGSTAAGRLLAALAVLLGVRYASSWLQGVVALVASSPEALAAGFASRLRSWSAAALAAREWYHGLFSKTLYLALLPLEAPAAALAWLAVSSMLEGLAGGAETLEEQLVVYTAAAAASWLAAAGVKGLGEALLLRPSRRAWLLAAAVGAAAMLAAAAVYPSLVYSVLLGRPAPGPLDDAGLEERLRQLMEGLEENLRGLVSLLWG